MSINRWMEKEAVVHIYNGILLLLLLSRFSRFWLCDPIDGKPPGSTIPGILQARTLERVAISFSNAWKWKVKVKSLSLVWLLVTPWTAGYQAPPSMGFSRQEYWSGVPLPSLMEYYSAIKMKEFESILMEWMKKRVWIHSNEVDEPKVCYTVWSKAEQEI